MSIIAATILKAVLTTTDFTSEQISICIGRGIDFLYHHQYPNGEFCVYSSGDDAMQNWNQPESSIFPSALIGSCLLFLKSYPRAGDILARTTAFLKYQMGYKGTWNHYTNYHPLRSVCPSDVDDTSCVSSLLMNCNVGFPKTENISLLLSNRRRDGKFYTWFTLRFPLQISKANGRRMVKEILHPFKTLAFWNKTACSRYDVDAVVNANILYYLGEREETKGIVDWLIHIINYQKENDCDKWYRNPFTIYYFISRNYFAGVTRLGTVKDPMISRILATTNPDGSFGESILDTALAICSLINLEFTGKELGKAVYFVLRSQKESGDWERRRLYYGGPKKLSGFGSEELTTAFCLEALERYRLHIS